MHKPMSLAPLAGSFRMQVKSATAEAPATDAALDAALTSVQARYGAKAEVKTFHLVDVKALDEEAGTFEGYLSVFGVVDHGNDRVIKGAFTKTLAEKAKAGRLFPLLWYHNPTEPLGVFTEMREDAKGLYVKGQLNLDVQAGREKYALLKQGAIDSMSIGYTALKWQTVKGVRDLQEIKLWEGSLVTFAMNEAALVTSVKAAGTEPPEGKAADFATTLDLSQRRSELASRRWKLDDALWAANHSALKADNLDRDARLAAIDDNLGQYHDAMLAWWSDWLTLLDDEAAASGEGTAEAKSLYPFEPIEGKAGRKVSAARRAKLEAALAALTDVLAEDAPAEEAEAEAKAQDGAQDSGEPTAAPVDTQPEPAPVASLVEQMKAGDALARMKAAQ